MKKSLRGLSIKTGKSLVGICILWGFCAEVRAQGFPVDVKEIVAYNSQSNSKGLHQPQKLEKNGIAMGFGVSSEQKIVQGKVTDEQGEPLPGASIMVEGTSNGTITDINGNYSLEVPEGAVILISYVGFEQKRVEVGDRSVIDISLSPDTASLDEVVVVGYGTMKKKHLTGAIGSIEMDEELGSRPVVDFGQAMYGKVAGVQVQKGSGRPGESTSIQIRGLSSLGAGSSPLVVIDGVPIPEFDLSTISPSDIESIDILKDAASAAIYGSRGANGVILVTTKSGKAGKPKFDVGYSFSLQRLIRKAPMMNTAEYAAASIDLAQNAWIDSGGDPNAPNTIEARGNYKYTWPEILETPEQLADIDWQDEAFSVAPMHRADLSFSGGTEKSQFYISGGMISQEGILMESGYDRYTLNLNADTKVNDWLKVGAMLNSMYSHENEVPPYVITYIYQYPPIFPIRSEDGYWGGTGTVDGFENYPQLLFRERGHPYSRSNDENLHNRFSTIGNLFAQIQLMKGLSFRSAFNVAIRRNDHTYYAAKERNLGPGTQEPGTFTSSMNRHINYSTEQMLSYGANWGDHNLDVLAGYEFFYRTYYGLTAQRRNYDNDLVKYLSSGNTVFDASDNFREDALISYLGRANYNYKGKYLASATFRRDGSSRFGPDNKWGNFPSVSAGWRIGDELFLQDQSLISNLTLRASYGMTGNNNFADYRWISQMAMARVSFGNHLGTSYYPSSVENPELRWERSQQVNLGLDLGLWNNRVNLETNYYVTESDGLLMDVPVPGVSGFTSVFTNIGEVQNKGIELNLTSHNLSGPLNWTSQITFSANRNRVTALGQDDAPLIYSNESTQQINQIGYPLFSFYGKIYEGSYRDQAAIEAGPDYPYTVHPGYGRYRDINDDGQIDDDDRTIIGNNQPDFVFAIHNSFNFKSFDFGFLWQGSVGNDVYDAQFRRSMVGNQGGRNYYTLKNDRWRSEQDPGDGYHFKLTADINGFDTQPSTYWIQDGSYIRLKDVTLGYTLPSGLAERVGVASARFYLNGMNLLTFQKSETLVDPENFGDGTGATDVVNPLERGVAHNPYPTTKVVTVGLNIGF